MSGARLRGVPTAYLALRQPTRGAVLVRVGGARRRQQDALRAELLAHLDAHADAMWKQGPPAHLTAGAIVLDARPSTSVLLTLHRKAGMWLQFGGHFEPGDVSVPGGGHPRGPRGVGIAELDLDARIVELDRHALVGSFGRCREHLDVRYAGGGLRRGRLRGQRGVAGRARGGRSRRCPAESAGEIAPAWWTRRARLLG